MATQRTASQVAVQVRESDDDEFFENQTDSDTRLERQESQDYFAEEATGCICKRRCPLLYGLILLALGILGTIAIIVCILYFENVETKEEKRIEDYYPTEDDYYTSVDCKDFNYTTMETSTENSSTLPNRTSNNDSRENVNASTDSTSNNTHTTIKSTTTEDLGTRGTDKFGKRVIEQNRNNGKDNEDRKVQESNKSTTTIKTKLEKCLDDI